MLFTIFIVLLIIDSTLLLAVVLLQSGKGGGLAALGGGGSSTDSFFGGRQAVTILTKMSWWCGGIFLFLCLVMAGLSTRGSQPQSVLQTEVEVGPPTPVVPAAPLPLDVQPSGDPQPSDTGG